MLARLAEPTPSIYISMLAMLVLAVPPFVKIPTEKQCLEKLNESIHQSIVGVFMNSLANKSSMSLELVEKDMKISKWKTNPSHFAMQR